MKAYTLYVPTQLGTGPGLLITQRHKPLLCGIFMRTILAFYYVGLSEALFGVAGFVEPVVQPCLARHHDWTHVVGINNLINGGNHA